MFTYTNTYIHIYRHSNFFVFIIVYVYDVYGCTYYTCMGVHITHTHTHSTGVEVRRQLCGVSSPPFTWVLELHPGHQACVATLNLPRVL